MVRGNEKTFTSRISHTNFLKNSQSSQLGFGKFAYFFKEKRVNSTDSAQELHEFSWKFKFHDVMVSSYEIAS